MLQDRIARSALILLCVASWSVPASAGMARVGMGGVFNVPVVSFQERPFETVVQQQFDYSCGSAALATLLSFHYDHPANEVDIFTAMYEAGDQSLIQEVGFSLLDMKNYLAGLGYRADGFRIAMDKLAVVGIPAIGLIEINGYRHFVVIKGIRGDKVLVGDPARGVRSYSREEFEQLRVDDIVFVIRDQATLAKANFNKAEDWRLQRALAPVGQAVDRDSLADHGVLARIPPQFRFAERQSVR